MDLKKIKRTRAFNTDDQDQAELTQEFWHDGVDSRNHGAFKHQY